METKIYIGCSGWSYKDWINIFYPTELSPKDYLSYYARFFNTVEINNTFYRFPTEKIVRSWSAQTPQKFKLSLKANRYITHVKRFENVKEPLNRLYGLSDILAEKMGCFLFQFPRTASFTLETLESLITQLDSRYDNVVEFRHKEWWNLQVIQALKAANIGFCTVSGFGLPEDLISINKKAYLRFHGDPPYASLYSHQALSQWTSRIKAASLDELWVYFNNDYNAYAVQNALKLKKLLEEQDSV
jgi:uncharacterized protein YecE (DUF72 family)